MKRIAIFILVLLLLSGLPGCASAASGTVTAEAALGIALQHAGLEEDQVRDLHTEYEVDRGVPLYEVEFEYEGWEYSYGISAETGEILSQSREDQQAR